MAFTVDLPFKVNIFLDTNILDDYAIGSNDNIQESINYLAQCPFVTLKSSHFVKYELTELLKAQYFNNEIKGNLGITQNEKVDLKKEWKLQGQSYLDYKDTVKEKVEKAIEAIETNLGFQFDELKLHEKITKPTCDLCLSTRISKEDSLVMVSCMSPDGEVVTDFSALLSNDKQYFKAYNESRNDVTSIFTKHGLNVPVFVSTKSLNGKVNIYDDRFSPDALHILWNQIILDLIAKKNSESFVGKTYKYGNKGFSAQCVYVNFGKNRHIVPTHNWITLIANNLSFYKTLPAESYWSMGNQITPPYTFQAEHMVSFLPRDGELSPTELMKFREEGNYCFMYEY